MLFTTLVVFYRYKLLLFYIITILHIILHYYHNRYYYHYYYSTLSPKVHSVRFGRPSFYLEFESVFNEVNNKLARPSKPILSNFLKIDNFNSS